MSKLNSLLTNFPLSRNIPWLQVPSIRMVTALGVAVTCLLHGSYPQEAQRNGELQGVASEGVLQQVIYTGDWYSVPLGTCEVPCRMQLITVPPEVESLVICPLTVSSMFLVAIRSPEPSVPWH